MFIAIKTDDGRIKGKISFYCRALHVSRQAFNKYLKTKATPWKYQPLADAMVAICREDECNDTYGRIRMYQTLDNAYKAYPMLRGAILHSDRGTQYTSELYRNAINKYGILQSMNSAGGRCHDGTVNSFAQISSDILAEV